ncbi:MAG: hypothetical protein HQ517_11640 [SAR324 cluster bacterium]|nr:hypothetical protein [SAR324 cluster bacterium]
MKTIMFLALSMVMSAVTFAHNGGPADSQNDENYRGWQSMSETHNVMHNTSISAKRTDNGITFIITADSDSSLESINKKFVDEQVNLETYLKDIDVTVHSLVNGVEIVLESSDKAVVSRLNADGSNLIYQYLHNQTTGFSASMGTRPSEYGLGRTHEWGTQGEMGPGAGYKNGFGHGRMHGWGARNEMGPGMMYQNNFDRQSRFGTYQQEVIPDGDVAETM